MDKVIDEMKQKGAQTASESSAKKPADKEEGNDSKESKQQKKKSSFDKLKEKTTPRENKLNPTKAAKQAGLIKGERGDAPLSDSDNKSIFSEELYIENSSKNYAIFDEFKSEILKNSLLKSFENKFQDDYLRKAYSIYKEQGRVSISSAGLILHSMGKSINAFKESNPKLSEVTAKTYETVIEKPLDFTMEHVIKPIIEPIIKGNQIIGDKLLNIIIGKEATENLYKAEQRFWHALGEEFNNYKGSLTPEQKVALDFSFKAAETIGVGKIYKEIGVAGGKIIFESTTGKVVKESADKLVLNVQKKLDGFEGHIEYAKIKDPDKIIAGIKFDKKQLQEKFKHASKFGVDGNYNKQNSELFKEKIKNHIRDKNVVEIKGTYRGEETVHYYNTKTGKNVMIDKNGDFVSGWELNKKQKEYLKKVGNVQ